MFAVDSWGRQIGIVPANEQANQCNYQDWWTTEEEQCTVTVQLTIKATPGGSVWKW